MNQQTTRIMNRFLLKTLKFNFLIAALLIAEMTATATVHIIRVRDSSTQFIPQYDGPILVGDTVLWLPMGPPMMAHTITSTDIPANAASFDVPWFPPADTSFQYVPTEIGVYDYICIPHVSSGMIGSFTVEGTTGIYANEGIEGIRIFPNPVLDRLYFDETGRFDQYRIYTLNGQLVQSGKPTSNNIPVAELTRGVYFIELTGDRRRMQKFVKE